MKSNKIIMFILSLSSYYLLIVEITTGKIEVCTKYKNMINYSLDNLKLVKMLCFTVNYTIL